MKKILAVAFILILSFSNAALAFDGFTDVSSVVMPQDKAIFYLAGNGIISGYDDGSFRPNNKITRAEVAAILYRARHGQKKPSAVSTVFEDVTANHWASGYIASAVNDGIINGIDEKHFAPEDNITNEQAMKMIVCMKGLTDDAEKRGGYPKGFVLTAVYNGIMDDVEIVFAPNAEASFQKDYATRGNIALMIYNALKN